MFGGVTFLSRYFLRDLRVVLVPPGGRKFTMRQERCRFRSEEQREAGVRGGGVVSHNNLPDIRIDRAGRRSFAGKRVR